MLRRIALGVVVVASFVPAFSIATSSAAGAATWQSWNQSCFKWILDIGKVDSAIKTDTAALSYRYLVIDFASLAIDGKHIKVCPSSPDGKTNALVKNYGSALYSTGYRCDIWAITKSNAQFNVCFGWLAREKALENQLTNRLTALFG